MSTGIIISQHFQTNMNQFTYTGSELDVFSRAKNWKSYYLSLSNKFLSNQENVLEVGAGIGSMTKLFLDSNKNLKWTAIEPDNENFSKLSSFISLFRNKRNNITIENTTVENFRCNSNKFSTIILVDVLEHIEDDKLLLIRFLDMLVDIGKIIIFVPAHQLLYSEFDKQIGHFRRYSKRNILKIVPSNFRIRQFKFIDSIGFFALLVNKIFIRSSNPSLSQILFWDTYLVPLSKIFDRIFRYRFGKNIFLVITKK